MTDLKSLTLPEMTAFLQSLGEPAFRGRQVFTWLHRGVTDFDGMTNLSKSLREKLKETCFITAPQVARKQVSRLDGTIKYLWELSDGNCIETVLMQYHHGNTVCISSQVGCRMGCAFCASTIAGKVRDLTPAEMLDQVLFTQKDSGLPVSNIVLMGIGEPLDNLDTVLKFLELVNHPDGMNIGMRHISLSTCGIVPGIRRLAELELQLTLSVSLHAPDSETRSKIMPINRAYDVEELFRACHDYFDKTGRRISFEYAMIDGVNDNDWQALVWIWQHESGWQWNATNPTSGAYGIPQSYPASKLAAAGSDWKDNAATQIKWGLQYIKQRYGSPHQAKEFWLRNNAY